MISQIFKTGAVLLLLATGTTMASTADADKKLKKEYPANEETNLLIKNKYGDVQFINWEKELISIEVVIEVDHSSDRKAQELLDLIDVDFDQNGNEIRAITNMDRRLNTRWFGVSKDFNIDYTIYHPASIDVEVVNSYGNIFINNMEGHLLLFLKYGDLTINELTRGNTKPVNEFHLSYGEGDIGSCNWATLYMKYFDCDVAEATALAVESKYGDHRINRASSILIDTKYDKLDIGRVKNFVAEGGYTDFDIQEVQKKLDIETKYGSLEVGYIPRGFESVSVTAEYCGIELGIEDGANYKLEAYSKYAGIRYPEDEFRVFQRIIENNETTLNGIVGTLEDPGRTVNINTRYGNARLR